MKKFLVTFLYIVLSLSIVGCTQESSNSGESSDGGTTDPGQDFGNPGNGSSNPSPGNNQCSGTTSDGTGSGQAIYHFYPFLAGGQSWVPGNYDFNNDLISQTFVNLQEASILFSTDTRLQVRFKVESQPNPPAGEEFCYGRATGQAADANPYTKLKFMVYLRDIICNDDPNNDPDPTQCDTGFSLGNRYRPQFIGPVDVGSCSNIIDLGSLRNSTQYGTTVEIANVQADSTCQANGDFCPAEDWVRQASCWRMTLQVVTDFTQSFK